MEVQGEENELGCNIDRVALVVKIPTSQRVEESRSNGN
jgi:hypothetical protein